MCGIAGYIGNGLKEGKTYIEKTKKSINHRGPDESGHYVDEKVCLINTRLSIIDLENGTQPFFNNEKTIAVVQNGEIYNFIEVKTELIKLGYKFTTNSDTEVILVAYQAYGIKCLDYLNGMFAIAIYDILKQKIFLCRDRLGVKPLYIFETEKNIFFSSEIKSFINLESFNNEIDEQSIHNYLKFNYIPLPNTIFKNVKHIKPGYYLEVDLNNFNRNYVQYWKIENSIENNNFTENQLIEKIDDILIDAVKIRLRSDVAIGAFLSGGLDSSLVCAVTSEVLKTKLETFSIGFKEKKYDESGWAKDVSNLFNLKNNVHILESNIVDLWEKITWYNDQPHGDISFIPTFILSQFVSRDYKLVFTGDGGDEAFCGYKKYINAESMNETEYFDSISLIKNDEDFNNLYSEEFKKKVDFSIPFKLFKSSIEEVSNKDFINKILYFDTKHLLPGNNLVKPDKMAMANSLETRSPFLDYRFFEFSYSINGDMKLKNNETKYILKKYALKYLPHNIVYREKQMFTVPIGEWFKSILKEYIENIINSESLRGRNIFNTEYLRKMLNDHISCKKDYTRELRAIVNLEIWFRIFIDGKKNF